MNENEISEMIELAMQARTKAYEPYSNFQVGACVKMENGSYYTGCNIENASYGATNCAERTAVFKAVYEGERQFSAIAVASDSENFTAPCGVCRQVLAEFCDAEMPVICINREGKYRILSLGELLPFAFSKKDME